jgi:hypothetical protein
MIHIGGWGYFPTILIYRTELSEQTRARHAPLITAAAILVKAHPALIQVPGQDHNPLAVGGAFSRNQPSIPSPVDRNLCGTQADEVNYSLHQVIFIIPARQTEQEIAPDPLRPQTEGIVLAKLFE